MSGQNCLHDDSSKTGKNNHFFNRLEAATVWRVAEFNDNFACPDVLLTAQSHFGDEWAMMVRLYIHSRLFIYLVAFIFPDFFAAELLTIDRSRLST